METKDQFFMNRAIELASRGRGWVNPNPLVGAVIVKEGQIIAEGWHERYGGLHAERNALKNCNGAPGGATMYVTLEPCCHYGKTPPCTEAIIASRISRVVVGMIDPNPLMAGKGIRLLQEAGIEVVAGVEEKKIRWQNRVFLKYITTRTPWVVMKTAMTLDGKIAAAGGDSRWVTGAEARQRVQQMRAEYMSIMVGSGTVGADDPMLNCRLEGDIRQPVRIIVDSKAAISTDKKLVATARQYPTIVAHTLRAGAQALASLAAAGVVALACEEKNGRVDVNDMLRQLGSRGIDAILLEGGGELNEAFIREGQVDEVYAFIAPKIIGGRNARTPVEGEGFEKMSEAVLLVGATVEQIGEDFLIRGQIQH